jgi:hypothetical protein
MGAHGRSYFGEVPKGYRKSCASNDRSGTTLPVGAGLLAIMPVQTPQIVQSAIASKPAPTKAMVLHQQSLLPQQHPTSNLVRSRN